MEPELQNRLAALEEKTNAIYESVEKTRKSFQIVLWVTVAMVVLPILGLLFVVPMFINSYLKTFEGLL